MSYRSFARAVVLCLVLTLLGPLLGALSVARADSVCVQCGHNYESHGSNTSCSCCVPGGPAPGPAPGGGGGELSGFALEILTCGIMGAVGLGVGLALGFMWLIARLSGDTEQGVFEHLGISGMFDDSGFVLTPMGIALGGAIMAGFYYPAVGISALASAAIDDDGEASSRVATRAEELRVEAAAAHDAFVSAHPSPDTAFDGTFFRAADDAAARRARLDEALAAANDVAAPVAAAPAPPAWPMAPTALADPTRRVVRPLAVDVPPAFLAPTHPHTLASRSRNVLDRTRALLGDGAAEARERLLEEVKDRAMGTLPNGVQRVLKAHLEVVEGTGDALARTRDEVVPTLAFGSASQGLRLADEFGGHTQETGERAIDEAWEIPSDGLVGWLRRGFRAKERQ